MITEEQYLATQDNLEKSEINQHAHEFLSHLCLKYHSEIKAATDDVTKIRIGDKYMAEIYAYLLLLGRK